jgi:hypothetical protein
MNPLVSRGRLLPAVVPMPGTGKGALRGHSGYAGTLKRVYSLRAAARGITAVASGHSFRLLGSRSTMRILSLRVGALLLFGLALFTWGLPAAWAQSSMGGSGCCCMRNSQQQSTSNRSLTAGAGQAALTAGNPVLAALSTAGQVNALMAARVAALNAVNYAGANPYAPYGGYGYEESPLGGYLRGTADIVNSQSNWIKGYEDARLAREQSNRERVENAKRRFDLWLYEREKTPTFEDDRQRLVADQLRRSLNDPPAGEVWSGLALNNILADLSKMAKKSDARGPQIPLDEDVVRHLNFTKGQGGNPGLLKNEGQLNWPQALRSDDYKAERDLLNSLAPETVRQAVNGRVDAGALKEFAGAVERLRTGVRATVGRLSSGDYMEALRFVRHLDEALVVLGRPDAGEYFTLKGRLDAPTAGDLVKFLVQKGWAFAPAVPGDEAAYAALHRALVLYHGGVTTGLTAER